VSFRNRRELARHVVRTALRVYRRHPATIAGIAAVVFAPLALIDSVASEQVDELSRQGGGRAVVAVMVLLGTSVLTAGSAVGAGLMDNLVAPHFGRERAELRVALARLPKARLVGVDLSVSAIVAIGTLLGAVPGIVAYTLLCLSGPLLVRDELGVREAMRRSVDLTRRNLLVTFLVVTVPVLVEHQILDALEVFWDFSFLVLFAAHIVTAVVVLATVVLVEISLALTLAHQEEHLDVHAEPVPL
jgi:hypothetical protein